MSDHATLNIYSTHGHAFSAGLFFNNGMLEADVNGTLNIDGDLANTAMTLVRDSGAMSVSGALTNTGVLNVSGGSLVVGRNLSGGQAQISTGGHLELDGHANSVNVNFGQGVPNEGELILGGHGANGGFSGTVSGYGSEASIDLLQVAFSSAPTVAYTGGTTTAGGALTAAGDHSVTLAMAGQFTGDDFHLSDDEHGGTLVTDLLNH